MGRGLSRLQTTALILALQHHEAAGHDRHMPHKKTWGYTAECADATYAEILCAYYGWQSAGNLCNSGRYHFSRTRIGSHRYDAAMAALSRAIWRLQNHELAICVWGIHGHWAGIDLADEGGRIARELSAKSLAIRPNITGG